jgi:hypothetical protein
MNVIAKLLTDALLDIDTNPFLKRGYLEPLSFVNAAVQLVIGFFVNQVNPFYLKLKRNVL